MNPLQQLHDQGQSVWLDEIRRSMLNDGELARMVRDDGLCGVTSNPSIFEKAIAGSADYRPQMEELLRVAAPATVEVYEQLAVDDIRRAAAVLRGVYDASCGADGFVSLEVAPHLAHDTEGTVAEALRLWSRLDSPNVMIKVPGTPEGIPAIRRLIAAGVNVNVTLLFSRRGYAEVVEAYLSGLEARAASGGALDRIASVASFFVSRIDTSIDRRLDELAEQAEGARRSELEALRGRAAVANAKLAYRTGRELFSGPRWQALADRGAQVQRLLWASTSTKNAAYRDVMYVEDLIGPDTVNTIPPATLAAFRDHGVVRPVLDEGLDEAEQALAELEAAGISLDTVTDELLADGVRLFAEAFDRLMEVVGRARTEILAGRARRMRASLPAALEGALERVRSNWTETDGTKRLWSHDAGLWTGADEARWLGWLDVVERQRRRLGRFAELAADASSFDHVLLLGMGGSSLAPEVFSQTFGRVPGHPRLAILDSTDPDQVRSVEAGLDLGRTLFVVASKSGTTLETRLFMRHFLARAADSVGTEEAPKRFIAITDPGSELEREAGERGFRAVLHGEPEIGGRFSALSDFGIAPAAMMGVDVARLLDRAAAMAAASGPGVTAVDNPGVALGLLLGAAARAGRDKLTLVASPGIADLAAWLEQLVAESTGKRGRAIIPIAGERLGPPEVYGDDRLFVELALAGEADAARDAALERLAAAGRPVVRITLDDRYDLGGELLRWEIATAVAGAVLGINPFDQPDVEASKMATGELTAAYERTGSLPTTAPLAAADGLTLFADDAWAQRLLAAAGGQRMVPALLKAHLAALAPGDYFAVLAWLEMNDAHAAAFDQLRHLVRDARRVATCVGFGPRFLHSTGQAYKGGPDTGVFLAVTAGDRDDLALPGMRATFGVVHSAQALGDLQVLAERGRRALRVDLGDDSAAGLARLLAAVLSALGGS